MLSILERQIMHKWMASKTRLERKQSTLAMMLNDYLQAYIVQGSSEKGICGQTWCQLLTLPRTHLILRGIMGYGLVCVYGMY